MVVWPMLPKFRLTGVVGDRLSPDADDCHPDALLGSNLLPTLYMIAFCHTFYTYSLPNCVPSYFYCVVEEKQTFAVYNRLRLNLVLTVLVVKIFLDTVMDDGIPGWVPSGRLVERDKFSPNCLTKPRYSRWSLTFPLPCLCQAVSTTP
jgi:hypothetical protein